MALLTEFFPILIFFGFFKWKGLMIATIAAILTTFVQLLVVKIKTGKYQKMQLTSFVSLLILGGIALICKKEIFIKWKPTVIYWILAIVFSVAHFFGKQPLIQKLSNNTLQLPKEVWDKLNLWWIVFFMLMGILNLYVVYYFNTDTWVNFKLFGTIGLTLIFIIIQAIFLSKYIKAN